MNEKPLSNKRLSRKACKYESAKKQITNGAYAWHRSGTSALENPLMTADTRESDMPRHAGAHAPSQRPLENEFLIFLFFAVSLVPPSECLGLRGNPLSLHSLPHVLVVVLTVKIQDNLHTPSCRQLFLYSMWVSNIWTDNPTVDGWKDGWKGEECCALWEKDRGENSPKTALLLVVCSMLHPQHQVSV